MKKAKNASSPAAKSKALVKLKAPVKSKAPVKLNASVKLNAPVKLNSPVKPKVAAVKTKVKLLSGGNPQIIKGDGDAPVQAFITAMPGWKREIGQQLDRLIVANVPGVRKAVRWNTPFFGIQDQGWFIGFHCATKYVKIAFFRGSLLNPIPPGESTQKDVRYLHVHEHEPLDEKQMISWIKQAANLPGATHF